MKVICVYLLVFYVVIINFYDVRVMFRLVVVI